MPTYDGAGRINRVWRVIQLFQQQPTYMNDRRLKSCMPKQESTIDFLMKEEVAKRVRIAPTNR